MTGKQRAVQIWAVLVWAARHGQTITYDDLGKLIGVPRQGLAPILAHIQSYCEKRGKGTPILTAIVVGKHNGLPSGGCHIAPENAPAEFQRVFNYKWDKINPTPEGKPIF